MDRADVSLLVGIIGTVLGAARYLYDQKQHRIDRETTIRLLSDIRDDIVTKG